MFRLKIHRRGWHRRTKQINETEKEEQQQQQKKKLQRSCRHLPLFQLNYLNSKRSLFFLFFLENLFTADSWMREIINPSTNKGPSSDTTEKKKDKKKRKQS